MFRSALVCTVALVASTAGLAADGLERRPSHHSAYNGVETDPAKMTLKSRRPTHGDARTEIAVEIDDTAARTAEVAPAPAAAPKTSCGLTVIGKSEHAVGEPCLTTAAFVKTLNLTEAQLARLETLMPGLAH